MKILIVDDSSTMRKLIMREIADSGYEIIEAESGEEAVEICRTVRPDLITLDIEMNGIDGFQTCKEIRAMELSNSPENYEQIPIIFFTGSDSFESRKKGFDVGATEFMSKKLERGELILEIDKILKSKERMKGLHALVVDDSQTSRMIMSSFLRGFGVEVTEATDGQIAYEMLKENSKKYDLVLTDHYMPNLSGLEFCEKVRRELGFKDLPIIFISSESKREEVLKFFSAGATDYLIKPFFNEELHARMLVHLETKATQNVLRDSITRLRKLDVLKDKFLAVCSHDLRSPLNGILGYAEILKEDPELHDEHKELVDYIELSGSKMLELINELLDISRIQLMEEDIKLGPVSLAHMAGLTVAQHDRMAKLKGIDIDLTDESSQKHRVAANKIVLMRILNNLLSNAIKFTKKDGEVKLSIKQSESTKRISVKDNGIGIPDDILSRLFDKDAEVGREGTEGEKTHGLGLAITKDLVEKLKGQIEVESVEGKGSCFHIDFPCTPAEKSENN